MFEFEKLDVYNEIKSYCYTCNKILKNNTEIDKIFLDELNENCIKVLSGFADGLSRIKRIEKQKKIQTSRIALIKNISIFDFLSDSKIINKEEYKIIYKKSEQISKRLFGLIRSFEK